MILFTKYNIKLCSSFTFSLLFKLTMSQLDQGSILFLRCQERDSCIPISNVFSIFENFNLVPSEHIIGKVSFKDLLLISKRFDHVVLMFCDHLKPKLETILQCLKSSKTVIAGIFKETSIENTKYFKQFPVTDVDSLASYVHANFNYEGVSRRREKKQSSTESDGNNETDENKEPTIVGVCKPPNTNELTEYNQVSVDEGQVKNDGLLYIPEECSLNSNMIIGLYYYKSKLINFEYFHITSRQYSILN